jgi:triacylglycerol lipase
VVCPFNVWSSICGLTGLSVQSPLLDSIYGDPLGINVYSIKSYVDQMVCATGYCTVCGIHSSSIWIEYAIYNYAFGHFGLQSNTATRQHNLIQ